MMRRSGTTTKNSKPVLNGTSDAGPVDADALPTGADWERLSSSAPKRAAYVEDLFFRECWRDVTDVLGADALPVLHSRALLLVKPDGVVARRLRGVLDHVRAAGFEPVHAVPVDLTRHSMREVWRHDWHAYPTDRLALATFLYTAARSLLVLLTRVDGQDPVPASSRLSQLKGHAEPSVRLPGQLRTELEPPNPVINFVHVADEPADVVRELGILLDRPQRRRVLAGLHRPSPAGPELVDLLDRLEREQPRHDFDLAATLCRLEGTGVLTVAAAADLRHRAATGESMSWVELCALADPYGGAVDIWDFICVASVVLPRGRLGATALLPDSQAAAWIG
jgi:hypothetical protein